AALTGAVSARPRVSRAASFIDSRIGTDLRRVGLAPLHPPRPRKEGAVGLVPRPTLQIVGTARGRVQGGGHGASGPVRAGRVTMNSAYRPSSDSTRSSPLCRRTTMS